MSNVVNFGLWRLLHKVAPWSTPEEQKAVLHVARKAGQRFLENEAILERMRGVPMQPGTEESDNDPRNPNARS